MKVNRNNYEIWMIDYFDGKLNADEIAAFMAFIDENPDLGEELEIFDSVMLEAEDISFDQKRSLKKLPLISVREVNETNYEEQFVAYFENDLLDTQKADVTAFVKLNPQLKSEFELHGKLVISPDESIHYTEKEELKKRPAIGIYWWAGSVAAAIVLLFGIFTLLQQTPDPAERLIYSLNKMEPRTVNNPSFNQENLTGFQVRIVKVASPIESEKKEAVEEIFQERVILASLPPRNYQTELIHLTDHAKVETSTYNNSDAIYASVSTIKEPKKPKGLLARIVKNYAARTSIRQTEKEAKRAVNKNDPGFVKLLNGSITVFNTITGSDTEMVKTYDQNGNLKHYQVEGESVAWSRNIASTPNQE